MYELDARCPCCAAPLVATVIVEDTGGDPQHGHTYDVGLELAPAQPQAQAGHEVAPRVETPCRYCGPFATAQERLECEASRRRMA